jgi:hypothetical protein
MPCIKHRESYVRRVKQHFALCAVPILVIVSLLSGCTTSSDSMSADSPSSAATSGTPVPGEKTSDDGRFSPGGPGASGSVHW